MTNQLTSGKRDKVSNFESFTKKKFEGFVIVLIFISLFIESLSFRLTKQFKKAFQKQPNCQSNTFVINCDKTRQHLQPGNVRPDKPDQLITDCSERLALNESLSQVFQHALKQKIIMNQTLYKQILMTALLCSRG